MKIVHIITSLSNGGAEAVLYRLCLHEQKNEHIVISLRDSGKYGPLLKKFGIAVQCLDMPPSRVTGRGIYRLGTTIRNEHPDIVQTWMYHADLLGGIIARLVGIKRVYWGIRNTDPDHAQSKRITRFIARCCALISFIIPEKIICCSQKSASDHQNMGYKKNKFIIIPNGYEINVFKPNTDERLRLRAQWQHDPTTLLFGMVARYDPHKDHNNLFKALAQLRQVPHHHCILVGEGITPRNTELTDLIKKHGVQDRVSLLGPQNNIPAIMNALDVHVLSSVGEAFPNVLAEAMACGTPCVTTNVGDAALIVGETGWIVPPNDPESLAQALKFAIQCKQNSQKWQCRKLACRKRITENFGIDRMINKYDMAWANIMN